MRVVVPSPAALDDPELADGLAVQGVGRPAGAGRPASPPKPAASYSTRPSSARERSRAWSERFDVAQPDDAALESAYGWPGSPPPSELRLQGEYCARDPSRELHLLHLRHRSVLAEQQALQQKIEKLELELRPLRSGEVVPQTVVEQLSSQMSQTQEKLARAGREASAEKSSCAAERAEWAPAFARARRVQATISKSSGCGAITSTRGAQPEGGTGKGRQAPPAAQSSASHSSIKRGKVARACSAKVARPAAHHGARNSLVLGGRKFPY